MAFPERRVHILVVVWEHNVPPRLPSARRKCAIYDYVDPPTQQSLEYLAAKVCFITVPIGCLLVPKLSSVQVHRMTTVSKLSTARVLPGWALQELFSLHLL